MVDSTLPRATDSRERAWTSYLAFSLYRELSGAPGNLVFSPYGLLGALMVARAGAAGSTRREIESVLRRQETGEALTASFGELLRQVGDFARPGAGLLGLLTANALWCQAGCPVRPHFVETLRARFGAEAGEVDFFGAPAEAARTVNAWVSEATRGRITALVTDDQVGALTRAMLSNVVSLAAPWLEPFDSSGTRPDPFHTGRGRPFDVATMHGGGTYPYLRLDHAHALHLPSVVSRVRMLVLLPDPGRLGAVERELDVGLYRRVLRQAESRAARLTLPRCQVSLSRSLRAPLERLGVVSAFGPAADFSRISERRGVFLDDLLHRAFVEIDESGAEAAARAAPDPGTGPGEVVDLRVDRPFLFLICDVESETLFFVGRVTDPRG